MGRSLTPLSIPELGFLGNSVVIVVWSTITMVIIVRSTVIIVWLVWLHFALQPLWPRVSLLARRECPVDHPGIAARPSVELSMPKTSFS